MLPLYLVLAGLAAGLVMVAWSLLRAPAVPVREGATGSRIGELAPGRFRVTGRVVAIKTTASEIDGAPCVYVERARYQPIVRGVLPLLREVAHAWESHAFWLDDGSGRILVDPRAVLIDCNTAVGEDGLVAERRLRAGEEVEMIAQFRASERPSAPDTSDDGPYRASASLFEAGPDGVGPPRISYRTQQGMQRAPLDPMGSFVRGAGVVMIATSLFFGAVVVLQAHWAFLQG